MNARQEQTQAVCPNCAGSFAADEPRCPYCGALNPAGAERAYMESLDDLKAETAGLADSSERGFRASLARNAKKTAAVVLAVACALAALFAVTDCMGRNEDRQAVRDYEAREAFREAYFGDMEQLYASGDDRALNDFVLGLVDEPGFDAVFSWKHYDMLEAVNDGEAVALAREFAGQDDFTLDDYVWAVQSALRLAQLSGDDSYRARSLPAEDVQRIAPYRELAWEYLQDTLQMNADEVAAFADACRDKQGYIDEDTLERNLKERLVQLGTLR